MRFLMTLVFLGLLTGLANATVVFDDGGTHTINSTIFDDVQLLNGSDLNVEQGGFIQGGIRRPYYGDPGSSTVTLSRNATVVGGINAGEQDDFLIMRDESLVVGSVSGQRRIEISNNSRITGNINNFFPGLVEIDISGGSVDGDIRADNEGIYLSMTGGRIGGIRKNTGAGGVSGTISGGEISRGIYNDGLGNLDISGGRIRGEDGGNTGGDALNINGDLFMQELTISGGVFDAGSGSTEDGWLMYLLGPLNVEITGGRFGYENAGNGFGIFGEHTTVDIFGWDLKLEDDLLTGFLMDGSWIETTVSLTREGGRFPGTLNLHNSYSVPEPSALLLLATGIVGLGFVSRKKKQTSTINGWRK